MSTPLSQGDGPSLGQLTGRGEQLLLNPVQDAMLKEAPFLTSDMHGNFVDLKKKTKTFNEGPLPPASPSQNQNGFLGTFKSPDLVNVKKPPLVPRRETFTPGLITVTGKRGVEELAENLYKLQSGTTGAIVEEGFEPLGDQYTEGTHFWVEQNVARGSFGSGKICTDSQPPFRQFFLKKMAKEDFRPSEVIVPMNLNNVNLTKFYGLIQREEENQKLTVEMMIEAAGRALNIFVQNKNLTQPQIIDITKQIMSGVKHMHYYGMIHFDLKPENICVQERDAGLLVKVTDFGSAKLPQEKIEFVGWTPEYMSPESSLLFLQKSGNLVLSKKITEADITGKHDVYASSLVIMYMYEKVHVLQRLITGGKTSYADIPLEARQLLQINLMKMLAVDPNFIQSIVPDSCDIDMRELLRNMTQYDPEQRYSAEDVISFIERRERRQNQVIKDCERRQLMRQQEQERLREQERTCITSTVDMVDNQVPEIAYKCLQTETGPIRMVTKDRLRQKLKPYPGNCKGKLMEETPVEEMRRLQAENNPVDDLQPPPTPVTEVAQSLANLDVKSPVNITERNAPVTQPEEAKQQPVNQSVMMPRIQQTIPATRSIRASINSRVLPPQPISTRQASTMELMTSNQVQKKEMIDKLRNGQLKIKMINNKPVLVMVPEGVPNRTGVRPLNPVPLAPPNTDALDLINVGALEPENIPNLPNFMKIG